ncbi:LVIVD repeat-containing protein [Salinigranum sp.]|uniref:LVIVD repeat-containing protein n=1 Tax=Salinigranum sp. TaxID=1966351 RepID=UPI003562D361
MRRRSVLRGAAALAGVSTLALPAGAHEGGGGEGTVSGGGSDRYGPLGHVDVPGALEAVVGDGNVVYVATGDGYASVDVSDPTAPAVLARRTGLRSESEDGPLVNVQDVTVDGDTLVVAGPAHPGRSALSGFVVVDVADPARPVERGFFETDYPIHNCDVVDGRAYLTGNDGARNPLVVVDVADPSDPTELGRWSLLDTDDRWEGVTANRRTLHDVTVHGDVAVCALWDAGTWLVDVADPTAMTALGSVESPAPDRLHGGHRPAATPPGNHHYATLADDLLAVGKETFGVPVDEDGDGRTDRVVGGPSGVDLWNVSDLAAPERLSTVHPPVSDDPTFGGTWTTAHNLDLRDGTLYTSWYQGGVKRHDVSAPRSPTEESWWLAPDETSFWTARAVSTGAAGFFVASSRGVDDVPGRLYTFPDRPGQGPSTAALRSKTGTDDATTGPASTRTGASEATSASADDDVASESTVSAPGFGTGAGLTALGVSVWWLRRRGRD